MAFLLYQEQAEVFVRQEYFEVDMSFKRIREKDINEIIFAFFDYKWGKGTGLNPNVLGTCSVANILLS